MESHSLEEIIIIGGGVAGLSCLNALLDRGSSALLIEGNQIGSPKMCGEFIAPEAVNVLQTWGIGPLLSIDQVNFKINNKYFLLTFPHQAGAFSRSEAELQLAKRALNKGGRILEKTLIQNVIPATDTTPYILKLASGEEMFAKTIFFAVGKYASTQKIELPYYGIKMHLAKSVPQNLLQMTSYKGAYFGVVPITKDKSNFACLIKKEIVEQAGDLKKFFANLLNENEFLHSLFQNQNTSSWLEGKAPAFHFKKIPRWPNAYWIGDAFVNLPPAIGSGFGNSVTSARLAVDYYLQNDPVGYQKSISNRLKTKLKIGKFFHHLLLNPSLANSMWPLANKNKWLINWIMQKIHF